jgi:putative transposase
VIGPELAIADGALGFWRAIEEVWPKTRIIECVCDLAVVVADESDGAGGIPLGNGVHDVHPRRVPDS